MKSGQRWHGMFPDKVLALFKYVLLYFKLNVVEFFFSSRNGFQFACISLWYMLPIHMLANNND